VTRPAAKLRKPRIKPKIKAEIKALAEIVDQRPLTWKERIRAVRLLKAIPENPH